MSSSRPPAFVINNVSFTYAMNVRALDSVSLAIEQGEKVAILGANGSGKSTLIKILDGLLFPQTGTLTAFGGEITETSLRDDSRSHAFRRRVGFIFQNSDAQLFSSTVREEIAFGPLQMQLSRAEIVQRTADVAALLGIEKLLDRAPFHLSGGEKKKVALASSLIINPDALLLDEPTNGLDPRSQRWLVEILKKLHAAGKTLVTATHDLNIVPEIADRILVFDEDHRLIADGPAAEIMRDTELLVQVNLIDEQWAARAARTDCPRSLP